MLSSGGSSAKDGNSSTIIDVELELESMCNADTLVHRLVKDI